MSLTVTNELSIILPARDAAQTAHGEIKQCDFSLAFDASYPTGGEALDFTTQTEEPMVNEVVRVEFEPCSGYVFEYDHTNKKVLVYYADYDAVADGALIQVPNTTDLSALTAVKGTVRGYAAP